LSDRLSNKIERTIPNIIVTSTSNGYFEFKLSQIYVHFKATCLLSNRIVSLKNSLSCKDMSKR